MLNSQLGVMFWRHATSPYGQSYRSPLCSYRFDVAVPEERALTQATRWFEESMGVDDWSDLAHGCDIFVGRWSP